MILKIHQVAANCHFLRFNQFFGPLYMPIRQLFNTIIYKMLIWFRRRRGKNPYLKISTGYQMSVKLILKIHQVAANCHFLRFNQFFGPLYMPIRQLFNTIIYKMLIWFRRRRGKNPYLKISTGYQMSVKLILKIHQVAANCHFLRFNQFFGPLYMPIRQLFNTIIYKMLIWFRRRRGKTLLKD